MAVIYITLTVFACVLVALLLNKLYKRTNDYHNLFVDTSKFSNDDSLPDNLQLVNLGSNHPKFGFDYDGLDVEAMNWAVGPQSLGKETLDRGSYYWGGNDTKKSVLSHLLKVCYPIYFQIRVGVIILRA